MSLENKAIIIEKSIEQLQDFYSLVGLVENKLKETSRLILLLLEPDDNNERCDKLSQHLFVKLEEEDVNYNPQNLMIEENNSKDFASVAELYGKTVNGGENKLNLRDQNAQVNESITEIAEQTGTEAAIKVARMEMRKRVQEYPSRPIPQIYNEVRRETFNQFDKNEQLAIAADFPLFRSIQSELFSHRKKRHSGDSKMKDEQERENKPNKKKKWRDYSGLCKECDKVFANLSSHKRNFHEQRVLDYTCPICSLEFKSVKYSKYYEHKQECEAASTGIMKYECPTCGLKLPSVKKNVDHQRVCNGSYKYNCHLTKQVPKHICSYENCEYKTSRKENLQNHINRVHLKIPIEKKYSCDQCGQSYSKISFLKDHIKTVHDKIRDLVCSECGAGFSTSTHLRNHRKIHSDVLGYACPYCTKAFKQSSVLYRHKLSCPMNPDK